ncbi:MAG: hypothetical protein ACXWL9_10545 [Syntrophales bacterium]
MTICQKCKNEINVPKIVGRKDTCPRCQADLRCCLNCRHYAPSYYNQCRESQAERVLDKDRANFCDYFKFKDSVSQGMTEGDKGTVRKKLDDLFK